MLPTHACASPHWSLRVFCALLECPCLSSAFSLHPICTMPTVPIHKSPHIHTGLATLPWLVHHYVPTIHLPLQFFLHPGAATHVPNLVTLPHLDAVAHLCH